MKCNCLFTIRNQQGAALLAFVLVMLVGSSFLMFSKLNAKMSDREDITQSFNSMQRAKEALIAFALTVPERNPGRGPGYLPCPDSNNDGAAGPACGGGGVAVGRIPYETLEEDVLTDDSGEVLWYVLAQNYRNVGGAPFIPLNSDTPSDNNAANLFILDGNAGGQDIVALIFAPGPALPGQNRLGAGVNAVINYLDVGNNDLDPNYISNLAGNLGNFNDRVIAITRQELMSAVEKRVLGEAADSLNLLWSLPGAGNEAFPWLSQFNAAPNAINYLGDVDTRQGMLPIYLPLAPLPAPAHNVVSADFNANWNGLTSLAVGDYDVSISATITNPSEICLRNSNCNEFLYCDPAVDVNCSIIAAATPLAVNNPMSTANPSVLNLNCVLDDRINVGRNDFNCSGDIDLGNICLNDNTGTCFGNVRRNYAITYRDDGTNINYAAPTSQLITPPPSTHLRRNLNVNGNFINQLVITVVDDNTAAPGAIGEIGRAQLTLDNLDPGGVMNIVNLDHHIDSFGVDLNGNNIYTDAGDVVPQIPRWFVDNNWHHLVQVAYPAFENLPGSAASACVVGANCIQLTSNFINPINNIRALAMISGAETPAQAGNRASNNINDYFDIAENQDLDDQFNDQLQSNAYNDQFRIINP